MPQTPRQAELSHRRAAGMARATAGRARVFEASRPEPDASEIAEGMEDWQRRGRTDVVREEDPEDPEDFADWDF